ncbi:MAG: hypothetical protein MK033_09555 [Candidatus Caenarcaniphilales bacterium]|nr:hypothetical protein [Candidatus Caenarcaniphilales bacterium]
MRLTLALLILIIAQSCSSIKSSTKQTQANPAKTSSQKPKAVESRFKEGDSLKKYFKGTKVQLLDGKTKKVSELLDSKKKNILVAVKPHCIFCQTLLATLVQNSKNKELLAEGKTLAKDTVAPVDINANIIFFTDAHHSSLEEFKAEAKSHESIAATWVYDLDNKLSRDFAVTAFPRFLIFDQDTKLVVDKRGLIPPENPEELKGMEVPAVLRKICENSVAWLAQQ